MVTSAEPCDGQMQQQAAGAIAGHVVLGPTGRVCARTSVLEGGTRPSLPLLSTVIGSPGARRTSPSQSQARTGESMKLENRLWNDARRPLPDQECSMIL